MRRLPMAVLFLNPADRPVKQGMLSTFTLAKGRQAWPSSCSNTEKNSSKAVARPSPQLIETGTVGVTSVAYLA